MKYISKIYKNITKAFAILIGLFVLSCNCPLEQENLQPICFVREATLTEFNPELIERTIQNPDGTIQTILVSGPRFSIHSFMFPYNYKTSGTLTNESLFQNVQNAYIFKLPFSDGSKYYAAIWDDLPPNSMMSGDILVSVVDTISLSYAHIRVFGWITSLPGTFYSENSEEFCNSMASLDNIILDNAQNNEIRYGLNLTNARAKQYSPSDVVVLDENNNIVTTPVPSINDIDNLLSKTINQSIDIEVRKGEVYYYKARLGKSYIFAITNISESSETPNKNRITIMFAPVF